MKKILLITLVIICGCKKDFFYKGSADFYNKSDAEVVLLRDYISYDYNPIYDTVLDYNFDNHRFTFIKVSPNTQFTFLYWHKEDKISAADTFSVFVLDKQVLDTVSWKQICSDYMVLCRYDLSGLDLKQLNSTIPYPPSPTMKDMKMYPPYEEINYEAD